MDFPGSATISPSSINPLHGSVVQPTNGPLLAAKRPFIESNQGRPVTGCAGTAIRNQPPMSAFI
jgi:hypothetical protein